MIQLNYRDSKPIYEQIKDGLRRLVITGVIESGEKLPSVRELAVQLSINPNTIQKAYRELEQEGYIYMISGKGSFAAPINDVTDHRKQEMMGKFDEVARELLFITNDPEVLKKRIDDIAAALDMTAVDEDQSVNGGEVI